MKRFLKVSLSAAATALIVFSCQTQKDIHRRDPYPEEKLGKPPLTIQGRAPEERRTDRPEPGENRGELAPIDIQDETAELCMKLQIFAEAEDDLAFSPSQIVPIRTILIEWKNALIDDSETENETFTKRILDILTKNQLRFINSDERPDAPPRNISGPSREKHGPISGNYIEMIEDILDKLSD